MKGKGFGLMVFYVDMVVVFMDLSVKVICVCIYWEN